MTEQEAGMLESIIWYKEDEYKDIKSILKYVWDDEVLETLKLTCSDMKATIAFKNIGKNGKYIKEGQVDEGVDQFVDLLNKAISVFERRKKYWKNCAEEKLDEIRSLIPESQAWEIDGEYVGGTGPDY